MSTLTQGFSTDDAASIAAVVNMLENEGAKLNTCSKVAPLWLDWVDLLRPTAADQPDRAMDLALELVTPGGIGISSPEEWLCPVCGAVVADRDVADARPPLHEHRGRAVALIGRAMGF